MNRNRLLLICVVILILMTIGFNLAGFGTNPLASSLNATGDDSGFTGPKGDVSIVVTGDVMFGRNVADVLSSGSSPFEGVSNVTSNADLLIINFENAATSSENAVKSDIPLKCDPSVVPLAKANNNTIAALANNHICDYGIEGMKDTINFVTNAGMTPIGAGNNESDAHSAVVKNINGRNITILNYMDSKNFEEYDYEQIPYANGSAPGYSAYDPADAQKQINESKGNGSDCVIVFLHYGNEYSTSPNDDQIKISHQLIDYGADVVIGSHPHVTQGIEMYKGKPIFYSMGNFIFDMSGNGVEDAYIVQIDLKNNTGYCSVYPVYISGYLPQFMDEDSATSLLNGLTPQPGNMKIENGVGKLEFNLTEN